MFWGNGCGRHKNGCHAHPNYLHFQGTSMRKASWKSFIQKWWPVLEIQSFEVENYFLMPFSLWNCAFLTIFDFKGLYFWNQSIFLNETFRRASSLRFTKNEGIMDGCGPCSKNTTFSKMAQKANKFWKIQKNVFCIFGSIL